MKSKEGKSKAAAGEQSAHYDFRDTVLAKIRGYPAWPAMVVDPESVPPRVTHDRPQGKKKFFCVRFFPAGDFAWVLPKDMSRLQTHEIEAYINEPYRKNGELLKGYKVAIDPAAWEAEKAAGAAAEADVEVDELASEPNEDDDDESGGGGSTKKRKRAVDDSKKARGKSRKDGADRPKKEGKKSGDKAKSKAMIESEDEGGPDEKAAPPAKKAKVSTAAIADLDPNDPQVKVKGWRHFLQKTFLNKEPPAEDNMEAADNMFKEIEEYDQMTIDLLSTSKLGKVMRHIAKMSETIPHEEEYHFRRRAQDLVDRWQQILTAHKSDGAKPNGDDMDIDSENAKPKDADEEEKVNDDAKEEDAHAEEDAPAEDAPAEDAPAEDAPAEDVPMAVEAAA